MNKAVDRGPRCPECGALVEYDGFNQSLVEVMTGRVHLCPELREQKTLKQQLLDVAELCRECGHRTFSLAEHGNQRFDLRLHQHNVLPSRQQATGPGQHREPLPIWELGTK